MAQYCRKIHENYTRYERLLSGLKFVDNEIIPIHEGKGSHRKWLLGQVVVHFVLNDKGHINIRQSKSLLIDYGFQVFVKEIDKPILRFDADGASHYNTHDDTIPLLEREIRTPHFHRFDKNGREFAYRTEAIQLNEYEIQHDIQIGLYYFCEENFIMSKQQKPLRIASQNELFPEEINSDLHKGISFP